MSEQSKQNKSLIIILCIVLLAAVALVIYQSVTKGNLSKEFETITASVKEHAENNQTLIAAKEAIEADLNAANDKIKGYEADLQEALGRHGELEKEIEKLKGEADSSAKKLEEAIANNKLVETAKADLETAKATLEKQADELTDKILALENQLKDALAPKATATPAPTATPAAGV